MSNTTPETATADVKKPADGKKKKAKPKHPYGLTPKKYIILRESAHWELRELDFVLSDNHPVHKRFAAFNNLKKEIKERAYKAVHLGLLDFTDDPETYTRPPKVRRKNPSNSRPTFKWNELDRREVKENRQPPKSPQFGNRTMQYPNPNAPESKLLAFQWQDVLKRLDGVMSQMEKPEAERFLKAALELEKAGKNPAMQPRRQVMDALNEKCVALGLKKAAITGVRSVPDPESDPDVVPKIAL